MNTIYEEKTKLSLGEQLQHRLTIHVYYISTISFWKNSSVNRILTELFVKWYGNKYLQFKF